VNSKDLNGHANGTQRNLAEISQACELFALSCPCNGYRLWTNNYSRLLIEILRLMAAEEITAGRSYHRWLGVINYLNAISTISICCP
jgi:hypothetical protein